jgi:hypothetical protein
MAILGEPIKYLNKASTFKSAPPSVAMIRSIKSFRAWILKLFVYLKKGIDSLKSHELWWTRYHFVWAFASEWAILNF